MESEIDHATSVGARGQIAASHARVAARGLDPDTHAPRHVPPEEVARRRKTNPLSFGMDRLALIFNEADDDTDLAMGVFDTDGVLLWRAGETRWLAVADQLQLVEGAVWDEASVNTTAISLVIADSRPIRVVGADHYNSALHGLYCAAAPIHDPRTGVLLGVVGLAGSADHVQPASTALATTMAALAEHEVVAAHHRSLAELRKSAGAQLAATRGPALLVDRDGWIADSRGCTPPDAVAAPDVGAHQFVPGIGTCVATAVGSGWLLRRVGPSNPILAELDLRGEPSLTVAGDGDEWRTVLTRRHAQILLLLAEAKESGLTSARLSRLIFGDTGHVVTVRAEMSRLRRVVGALLASRPYRLAPGVTLHVAPGSVSTAPGVNGLGVNDLGVDGSGVNGLGVNGLGVNGLGVNGLGVAPEPPHTPGGARHRRLA